MSFFGKLCVFLSWLDKEPVWGMQFIEQMRKENEVVASEVRSIQKTDSVRIQDGMCSTQLPAKLIVSADKVLGEMCRRGSTSPELRVYYGTKGGLVAWHCEWGAFSCWSSTPWGAIDNLARQLKELTEID